MMAVIANKKVNLQALLTAFPFVTKTGQRSFRHGALEVASMLQAVLQFDADVPDFQQQRIIADALQEVTVEGTADAQALLGAIKRHENTYLAQPLVRYFLVTSFSAEHTDHMRPIRTGIATIMFASHLPRRYSRKTLIPSGLPAEPEPEGFTSVRVAVHARNHHDAFERAFGELDYARGVLNFCRNRKTLSRLNLGWDSSGFIWQGAGQSINDIRVGPFHTVHDAQGDVAGDIYWSRTNPVGKSVSLWTEWQQISIETAKIIRRVNLVPYANDLKQAFARYAQALDSADFDSVFLKLWALLEMLTATGQSYDRTIDRVLFVYADEEPHRSVLEHLRAYRNAAVHRGKSLQQVEILSWQLKSYVETLLRQHLSLGLTFESIADVGEFMQLPRDPGDLRAKAKKLLRAARYRGG